METFQEVIHSGKPVLVDFYAEWCGPCKAMNPVIREVAQMVEGTARVIKVDIDQAQAAAAYFNVNAVPTFMIFKNGEAIWRHSGMIDKQSLLQKLQKATS